MPLAGAGAFPLSPGRRLHPRRLLIAGRRLTRAGIAGVGALLLLALGLIIYVAVEGGFSEGFVDIRHWVFRAVRRYGVWGSLGLLYIEESGIPLPVPGDVYVSYLGHLSAGNWGRRLLYWLAIIAVVAAGSSNLYWISRRWGSRLVAHPWARHVHLDRAQIERAHLWFDRWGVLTVIFGRHIPGGRVPVTVVAGTLGFPYRLFVPAVIVSTAIWAAVFLILGEAFGRLVGRFVGGHAWAYALGTLAVVALVAVIVYRAGRSSVADEGAA